MSLRTEQEQLEAFSNWWKENGTFIVVAVIVLMSSYFGWAAWQKHQQTRATEASALFQQILDQNNGADKASSATTTELADQLKKDYTNTYYGQAVRLLLAEEAVKNGNLDVAETELTALVQQNPDEVLAYTARLRLSRVLYAQEKYEAALIQLKGDVPDAYKSLFAELQGDVLVAQMLPVRAREAYTIALNSLPEGSGEQKRTIEMKLNSIAAK